MIDLDFTAQFIAGFEGFVGTVYRDAVGVETIGYGETRPDVIERCRQCGISQEDALQLLKQRVQEFADAVEGCITNTAALTPNRHAALTSLTYNIGVGGFRDSTACKRFNAGDLAGVPEAMGWWNKGGDTVLEGLVRRRSAEEALFTQDGPPASSPGQNLVVTDSGAGSGLLRQGDGGDGVRQVQQGLVANGFPVAVDGIFGAGTADAVRSFQQAHGLDADGVVGPATRLALSTTPPPKSEPDSSTVPPWPGRLMQEGVAGDDVRQVQRRLADRGWAIVVDASFGPRTGGTVRAYQGEKALVLDGIVGPVTWQSLWADPITT